MNPLLAVRGRQFLQDTTGSGLFEFAIAIAALLTAIVAAVSGSLAVYANHYVANAARDAARYAMVRGSGWGGTACASASSYGCTATSAAVQSYVLSSVPGGLKTANVAVATTWPGTNAAGSACYLGNGANGTGCSVKVVVTYTFNLALPLLPQKTLQFSSSATMPITQ